VDRDEHIKPDTTVDQLAGLPPAFKENGVVTAGNASGINDGAAAVVVTTLKRARALGAAPLGRIVSWGVAGVDPDIMGIGPVPASRQALHRAGLGIRELDLVEINEAFAAQYLAVERELGLDREKSNVNGGAVALGHPVVPRGRGFVSPCCRSGDGEGAASASPPSASGAGRESPCVVEALHD
jgi:acetyl-CoA acetyltransferase family protein